MEDVLSQALVLVHMVELLLVHILMAVDPSQVCKIFWIILISQHLILYRMIFFYENDVFNLDYD